MNSKFDQYAHPDALVDGAWLQAHLAEPGIRIVESNEDVLLYDTSHIPGAVHIDWRGDLLHNANPWPNSSTFRSNIKPKNRSTTASRP